MAEGSPVVSGASAAWARRRLTLALPFVASAAGHAAVVAGAFFVVWSVSRAPDPPPGPPAVIDFRDPSRARSEGGESDQREAPETPAAEAIAPAETTPVEAPPELGDLLARLDASRSASAVPSSPADDLSDLMRERTLPEVEFFGMGASAVERIVYVVDASGSTISLFPLLKREIERSIRRLAPAQQFQVIFFQSDPRTGEATARGAPHPAQPYRTRETRLIRATRSNVNDVVRWIEDARPRGKSNPLPALEVAMALEPEAIFLLSGPILGAGNWDVSPERVLERLDELNPVDRRSGYRPVTIKAIEFLEADPSGILRAIGVTHGGPDGHELLTREELTAP